MSGLSLDRMHDDTKMRRFPQSVTFYIYIDSLQNEIYTTKGYVITYIHLHLLFIKLFLKRYFSKILNINFLSR